VSIDQHPDGGEMKRLNIVIPFRDRHQHLSRFVPHVRAYFSRDKLDSKIPYTVTIVEQQAGLPFNRGALKNIGYLLRKNDSEYTCFHDVDYLPIWADYSWVDVPTPIVWYGAEERPLTLRPDSPIVKHKLDLFFGGAILVPNGLFFDVNGYSNEYWGWGYEDSDIQKRFKEKGILFGRRKGTFSPLFHDNEGYNADCTPTTIASFNERLYKKKWQAANISMSNDGLSNISFEVLEKKLLPKDNFERYAVWEIVTVKINSTLQDG